METSNRIFYRLKEMGLEQKAFAQALGTTDKTVSAWKTGRSKSYTKYLPQIAKVIDMPVEIFLNLTPSLFRSGPSSAHLRHGILPILQLF